MSSYRLLIDQAYLKETFQQLAEIGRDPGGRGYQRLAWTAAEREAHRWFRAKADQLGFPTWTDHAGNSFADFTGDADRSVPALAIGSHLDTVPYGGAFDGGLGVVAALAVGKAIKESGLTLARTLRLAAFTDEEGPRFGTGLLGSKALAGALDMDLIRNAHDSTGIPLNKAMAASACDLESLPLVQQSLKRFAGYLELHIEQGPRLERSDIRTGAVTAVTGIRQISVCFHGKTNHAGTTPKQERKNALRAASETIVRFSDWVDQTDNLVANPGKILVHPNAANVVPGEAQVDWDIRSPDSALLDQAYAKLDEYVQDVAASTGVEVTHRLFHDVPPCPLFSPWIQITEQCAQELDISITRLVSWAGHDAGVLGLVIPTAMIFVPSQAGISHAPEEFSSDAALVDGTQLLGQTALSILLKEGPL